MIVVVRAGQKLLGIYNKGSLKTYQQATNIIIQRCEFLKVVKKLGFSDLLVSALSQEIASHCYDIFLQAYNLAIVVLIFVCGEGAAWYSCKARSLSRTIERLDS